MDKGSTLYTADSRGYIRLIDYMGNDIRHVNAAKASFAKESTEFKKPEERLTNFLANSEPAHTSPFRHAQITLEVKAPLFVARQWYKHIIGGRYTEMDEEIPQAFNDTGWNEASGRYIPYDDPWIPEYFRIAPENKKQGSIDIPHPHNEQWLDMYKQHVENGVRLYEAMVADNVAAEQARTLLGLNSYTSFYWTASFQAMAHFVNLRDHPEAQKEIQEYAKIIDTIMRDLFPYSWTQRRGLR